MRRTIRGGWSKNDNRALFSTTFGKYKYIESGPGKGFRCVYPLDRRNPIYCRVVLGNPFIYWASHHLESSYRFIQEPYICSSYNGLRCVYPTGEDNG
jgi:hypothetical protein